MRSYTSIFVTTKWAFVMKCLASLTKPRLSRFLPTMCKAMP